MSPFNPFKKKEEEKIEEKIEPQKPKKKTVGTGFGILSSPHITEKATAHSEKGKYIFKVESSANKIEIKKAVQGMYGVVVASVRIINVKGKIKRRGKSFSRAKSFKKAIVELEKGHKIDILPI